MATKQRDLLDENQILKMRSCSRGFDAVIGRKFRETVGPLIEDCTKALLEAQQQVKRTHPDVDVFPGYVESDLLESSTLTLSLADDEAIKILDEYGEEVIGTTVAELKHMQHQSPRLGDVFTLAQLINSVKESHKMTLALQKLKESAYVLRDHLEEEPEMQEIIQQATAPRRYRFFVMLHAMFWTILCIFLRRYFNTYCGYFSSLRE